MKNHPKYRSQWQRYVNELTGRGEYRLISPSLTMKLQTEMAHAAMEANRAADIYMRGGLHEKAVMWREWATQLRSWIAQLNNTFTHP